MKLIPTRLMFVIAVGVISFAGFLAFPHAAKAASCSITINQGGNGSHLDVYINWSFTNGELNGDNTVQWGVWFDDGGSQGNGAQDASPGGAGWMGHDYGSTGTYTISYSVQARSNPSANCSDSGRRTWNYNCSGSTCSGPVTKGPGETVCGTDTLEYKCGPSGFNTGSFSWDNNSCAACAVYGCTDPNALNYNSGATKDDGSCTYAKYRWSGSCGCIRDDTYGTTTNSSCSDLPACVVTVNGSCSASHYACNAGTSVSNVDGATAWTWACNGSGGGSNASCSETKPTTPINGVCSASHYACNAGTSGSNSDNATNWTWACNGSGGGSDASCSEAKTPPPTVALSANPSSITTGASSTLTWSSTNATSCAASAAWSGSRALSGSLAVSPGATSAYTLTCTGAGGSASQSATITVTAAPPPPPSGLALDNGTTCAHIILSWTDNSTNETGFKIYRGTSAGNLALLTSVGANLTTYNDTPPSTGVSYYYAVTAYTSSPAFESAQSNIASAFNQPCVANMVNNSTNKIIASINGIAYSPSIVIATGNTVTFRINLHNTGPAAAVINYLCDTPSTNFQNLRNLSVVGGGSASFTGASCTSGTEIKISGMTIAANSSRTISYDSTFTSSGSETLELCSNTAVINYSDSAANTQTVKFGPTFCNKANGGSPGFQEVAP